MKKIIVTAVILSLLALSVIFSACKPNEPQKTEYTITYTAENGGYIEGNATQTVEEGLDGETVKAVPNEGYEFVQWSDGVETAERTDKNITENKTYSATFKRNVFTVKYVAEKGGYIYKYDNNNAVLEQGSEIVQNVKEGNFCYGVAVKAYDGYKFTGWSDGEELTWRQDIVKEDTTYTALFSRIDEYNLTGWYASDVSGCPKVEITKDNYKEVKFPFPEREHFTFNGWYFGEDRVADDNGNSLITEEMLDYGGRNIEAKWTANENFTYKILLIYVTRIDATLYSTVTKSQIHVDYTMSETEREFCKLSTTKLKNYLDDMLDGLVDFQVDEYFTKELITTDNFQKMSFGHDTSYGLYPFLIPEITNTLQNYDSALTIFNMNDYDYKLHFVSGSAGSKYGQINFDSALHAFEVYDYTLEQAIEMLKNNTDVNLWGDTDLLKNYWFSTLIHELAHTIELRVNLYKFHDALSELYNIQNLEMIETLKMYYLQETVIDGEKVGIPYAFWKGDIAKVSYMVEKTNIVNYPYGGRIDSTANHPHRYETDPHGIAGYNIYDVIYGTTLTATAVPHDGFKFVKWSDGVETPTRTDLITGNLTVTAIFEKI